MASRSATPPPRWREWLLGVPASGGACRANVLFNAAVAGGLSAWGYTALVEVEMMLYAASHLLFLAAFIALRHQKPSVRRPFRLPGGIVSACAFAAPPLLFCVAALGANLRTPARAAACAAVVLTGCAGHAAGWLLLPCLRRVATERELGRRRCAPSEV